MVTRGGPTVQLLRPAGGRVADVGLELRRQNLARRQQNIQADLAEMRADIDRDRLRESARQFDINQLFRREALEIESALSGRRLQISAGQLALGEQRFELTMEQAIQQETRAQQAQGLQERQFDERLRATRVRERREGEQIRRGRESLDAKDFRADIEFIGKNLLRFDPETRQISLPEGLQPLVERIIERARERGIELTIPQLIEASSPVASQIGRQRVQQEARNQLSQGLSRAQIRNLNAAAQQKLEGGPGDRRQVATQIRNLNQRINRDIKRIQKVGSDLAGLDEKQGTDQRDLDIAKRNFAAAQLAFKADKTPDNQQKVTDFQDDVNELVGTLEVRNRRIEQLRLSRDEIANDIRQNRAKRAGIGTGVTRQIGGQRVGFEPATIPAAPGAERSQVISGILAGNQTRQAVDFWKKGLADLDASSKRLDKVTEPEEREFRKRAEEKRRSDFENNLEQAILGQQNQEREVTQFIGNMNFQTAFSEATALTKQINDLKQQQRSSGMLIASGKISGRVLENRRQQLVNMSRILDVSTQRKIQVQGKLDELSETKGDLNRLRQLSFSQVVDASKPENSVAVRQIGVKANRALTDIYGKAPPPPQRGTDSRMPDERNLTAAEEQRRGRRFLASVRDGSYYRKVRNVLDSTTRQFLIPRRIEAFEMTEADRNIIMVGAMNVLNRNFRGTRFIRESEAPEGVFMPSRLRGSLQAFVLFNREQEGKLIEEEGEPPRIVSVPRNLGVFEFFGDPSAGIRAKVQVENDIRERLRVNVANGTFNPEVIPAFKVMMMLRGFEDLDIEDTLRPFDFYNLMGPTEEPSRPTVPPEVIGEPEELEFTPPFTPEELAEIEGTPKATPETETPES